MALVEAHPTARLLVDETYREMTYGAPLPQAATLSPRVIGVSGMSKTYGLPGIRTGWLTTRDRDLMTTLLAAKEQMHITGSLVDESIAAHALERRGVLLPPILDAIAAALATVRAWLATEPRIAWVEPRGGVVGFPWIRPDAGIDPDAFHRVLVERHATAVGPGHWFERPRAFFRLGFGWPPPTELAEGLARISRTLDEVAGTGPDVGDVRLRRLGLRRSASPRGRDVADRRGSGAAPPHAGRLFRHRASTGRPASTDGAIVPRDRRTGRGPRTGPTPRTPRTGGTPRTRRTPRTGPTPRTGALPALGGRRQANTRVVATSHQTRPGARGGASPSVSALTHADEEPGKRAENTSG